jgi:hypothetical protein
MQRARVLADDPNGETEIGAELKARVGHAGFITQLRRSRTAIANGRTVACSASLESTATEVFAWLGATCPRAEAAMTQLEAYTFDRAELAVPGATAAWVAAAYAKVVVDVVRTVQIRHMRS